MLKDGRMMLSILIILTTIHIPFALSEVICDGSRPCLNNGLCTGMISSNGTLTTECRCFNGFTGRMCESYKCPINPCQNGASCHFDGKYFRCKCAAGFVGDFCELRQKTACDSMDCGNGECALIRGRLDAGVCQCHHGFTGSNCRQIEHCHPDSCSGHGDCLNGLSDYSCQCNLGFGGKFCEKNIDECAVHACAEGATCIDAIATYHCICPVGKVGQFCQFNDPCFNDYIMCGPGTCYSTPHGEPVCQCPEGLTGEFCQQDINECATSAMCGENGDCINNHGSFFCACDDGFYGDYCQYDVIVQPILPQLHIFDLIMALSVVAAVFIIATIIIVLMMIKRCFTKSYAPMDAESIPYYQKAPIYKVTLQI